MTWMLAPLAAMWLTLGASEEPYYGPCRVQQVVDGDTADVRCGEEIARVRLLDVNAPDRGEVGHAEAGQGLRQLLAGRALWLGFALPGRPTLDSEGRLLAHLFDEKGRNLNVELVRLGWASYREPRGVSRYAANFSAAESEARLGRRAMWSVWSVNAQGH